MPTPHEQLPNVFYLQPKFMFSILSFVNLLNFMDRGIIPGATNEFNTFIQDSMDTDTPDVYLGLLQSAFVIGFIIGSLIFGHMIHHYGRFFLTGVGLTIWSVAVILSGCSYYANSYIFLIFARMLSGFGEASLQCSVPPWIESTAPAGTKGTWLAIFYTAIPVGTAFGYAYSSILAESVGWQFAFFVEALLMLPCVIYLYSISHHFPCEHETTKTTRQKSIEEGGNEVDTKRVLSVTRDPNVDINSRDPSIDVQNTAPPPSVLEEFLAVTSRPVFLCLTAGYAAQTGALIGLSTFGSAFIMGLGYFDSESEASTVFGVLVSVAGIFGTVLGGVILDRMMLSSAANKEADEAIVNALDGNTSPLFDHTTEGYEHTVSDGSQYKVELHNISKLIAVSSLIGLVCLCCNYFVYNKGLFLTMTTLGCFFIFLCGSGINMGVMLSVPHVNRSFGIAIMAVCIHVFGDVPSPVIAGLLKDYLAPGCVPSSDGDDENIATSDACRDDNQGLRVCMLLICLWLIWTAVFFAIAWFFNWRNNTSCSLCINCAKMCGHHPEAKGNYSAVHTSERIEDTAVTNRGSSGLQSRGSQGSLTSRRSTGEHNSSSHSLTNPVSAAAEPYSDYVHNKKQEVARSKSTDSRGSLGDESASMRSRRLSGSLVKSSSTEDLANIFKNASGTGSANSSYNSNSGNVGKASKKNKKGKQSGRSFSSDDATTNPIVSDTVMV